MNASPHISNEHLTTDKDNVNGNIANNYLEEQDIKFISYSCKAPLIIKDR